MILLLVGRVNNVNGDPLTYRIGKETVSVVKCDKNASGELVIRSSYAKKPVTSIGPSAFSSCSRLTSVRIPDSVTSIGDRAFRYCSNLTSVTIPDSVTSIEGWTFDYCGSLTSVTIPDSVTSIGKKAFAHCSSLTSVTIGNSVTSIGNLAFYDSVSLTSVTIPDSVSSIGNRALEYCGLTSVIIGDNVTSIGSNVFAYCSSLISVTIPDSILRSGIAGVFSSSQKNLKSVTISGSVTNIPKYAFNGSSSLTSVRIPDSITSIEKSAFSSCRSLTSVTFEGDAPSLEANVFRNVSGNAKIFINPGATGFGKIFGGLPVIILTKLRINSFNNHAAPFNLSFDENRKSKPDSTYIIEASHDLKKWGEIGKIQGTGSSVKFTDWREAIFEKQYYRVKLVE